MRRIPFALVLLALVGLPLLMAADTAREVPGDDEFFKDLNVVVYLRGAGMDSPVMVEAPQFQTIKGRLFLTGTSPDLGHKDDWTAGAKVGAAWEDVTEFVLLDDQQMEERLRAEDGSL
jgi:hypothetical protein